MSDSPIKDMVDIAVREARGPVVLDRTAEELPAGLLSAAQPLSGLDAQGQPFHIFVVGFDRVGGSEAVISRAD